MANWFRELGSTGIQVSQLALGTVKFGRNHGVKYPNSFELPDLKTLDNLLGVAQELGVNYLDTAPAYGESEARIGQLLKGRRQDWIISSKVGEYLEGTESFYDYSEAATRTSINTSLARLQTEYLDVVFVHSSGDDANIIRSQPVLECLTKLKDEGVIGAIGFSGKDAEGSVLAMEIADVFMVTLNLEDRSQIDLIEKCKQSDKGVVIKKALASGHSKDPDASLRFAVDHAGVSSVIVGTINPEHLVRNVAAVRAS